MATLTGVPRPENQLPLITEDVAHIRALDDDGRSVRISTADLAAADADLPLASNGIGHIRALDPDGVPILAFPTRINVQDYRRNGDSDWSAAFQRAYDAAMATTYGGEIFIPPPSVSSDQYSISQQIDCYLDTNKQVDFTGSGHASRVKLSSALGEVGGFLVAAPSAVYEARVCFNNFSIVGFGAGSVGVELDKANGVQFNGMRITILQDGVRAKDTFAAGFDRTRFRDIRGHAFHSTTIAHDTVFSRCNFNTIGRADDKSLIKIDAASDNIIVSLCDIEGGHHFLELNGGRALRVTGNYIEYYDGEWFKFDSLVYAPIIENNWLALSPNQSLYNMVGGRFSHNSIYDQAPGAMSVIPASWSFTRMEVQGNRVFGTALMASHTDWSYQGSGSETTQLLEDRTLAFKTLSTTFVADQYIGGIAFKNYNNVSIAGIGAHFKANGDGAASYLTVRADNTPDALKIEGAMTTAKGGVTDAVGRLQALPRTTTAALTDISNAINTTNKFSGKAVINTTTGAIVTANGASAASTWLALDGTTAHTPV